MNDVTQLIDRLASDHTLTEGEYVYLIEHRDSTVQEYAARLADAVRRRIYGTDVYVRGLIEIGNVCRNDCYYCGIRRSNRECERYILTLDEIMECCAEGHRLGFRTFVLQGGEGVMPVDEVCRTVSEIRRQHPDCAITLSLGEYERTDYRRMREAGADRYLLRHETADEHHYSKLHPSEMSLGHRIECLYVLRELGFQVGCGFMVGSPYQTSRSLARDLRFIEDFSPDMCGIGPFIPHHGTPFRDCLAGDVELTLYLLSLIRLIKPNILLPSTTALGTLDTRGRERGILAGANVVMPNLSPVSVRRKYELYDDKICTGEESAQCRDCLNARMRGIGYELVTDRGDIKKI